jgi:hypothetical protein
LLNVQTDHKGYFWFYSSGKNNFIIIGMAHHSSFKLGESSEEAYEYFQSLDKYCSVDNVDFVVWLFVILFNTLFNIARSHSSIIQWIIVSFIFSSVALLYSILPLLCSQSTISSTDTTTTTETIWHKTLKHHLWMFIFWTLSLIPAIFIVPMSFTTLKVLLAMYIVWTCLILYHVIKLLTLNLESSELLE